MLLKKKKTENVVSSSYTEEWPTPFKDPAVASERCAINPESEIPELRMRMSKTSRFERKPEEQQAWNSQSMSLVSSMNTQTCKYLRRYKEHEILVDERWHWRGRSIWADLIIQRSNIKHFNLQVTFAWEPNSMCKARENIRCDQVHSGGPSRTPSKQHFQYS